MSIVSRKHFIISSCLALIFALGLMISTASMPATAQDATKTPRPLPTASTTPLPHVDLPAWMLAPEAAVVIMRAYENQDDSGNGITFLNAATDERVVLDLPYVDAAGWIKAADEVYIQLKRYQSSGADNSEGFNEYINLTSGLLV